MAESWSNWSGGVQAEPRRIERPTSETALQDAVRAAARDGLDVRVAGTGHSFTPVVATDGVIVSLDGLQGLVSTGPAANEATLWGGTKLWRGTHELWEAGLGLANQGDIDMQSVAGAIGTGTHGTGPAFGNIPSRVTGMRLVTASGEILDTRDAHPDVLRAARVSLGMLGVTSQVTIACLPRYALHERRWQTPIDDALEQLATNIASNEHYEFFWYPIADTTECKALNTVSEAPVGEEPPALDGPGERTGWSHRIYPSVRDQKFNEMEYSVPAEAGPACFREVREVMRTEFPKWGWPVEYRTLAADDAMLSPANGRPTVTISVHQDASRPYEPYFRAVETVFRKHAGRPHWGKIHWQTRDDLRAAYPEFDAFCELRRSLDPDGRFLSPYLRTLFA
ncbi:MAG: D-arabinono-1,4-lactone oxidase [Dehalococcoidia bacterium]